MFDQKPPIPEPHSIGKLADKYRFGEMGIGDSIYIEGWNDGMRLRRAAAAYSGRHLEWRYRSRVENRTWEGGKPPGVRIWRI